MTALAERPTFVDGQVVAAADLDGSVDYARDSLARHLRVQHLWGIVSGLELSGEERQTQNGDPYVEVTVGAGLAVDGNGRAILVGEPARLSESTFDQLNVAIADPEARYPVFLVGLDRAAASAAAGRVGRCGGGGAGRVAEAWEIVFERPGADLDLDAQPAPAVGDGPGDGSGNRWRLLLGFVQWQASLSRFTAVSGSADGVGRTYAGLRAGSVCAAAGRLRLVGGDRFEDGAPALVLEAGDEGGLSFGLQDASGRVSPVLTVDGSGNLEVTGKIRGALSGTVQVESGLATDGLLLPAGKADQVAHYQVTPLFGPPPASLPAPPAGEQWVGHPLECRVVDGRVRSRFRWVLTDGSDQQVRFNPCQYTVLFHTADEDGEEGGS